MSRLRSNQLVVIDSGMALRRLRDRLRISQRALAARSRVDCGHISRYETGLMAPSLFTAIRLARAMGYGVATFWDELPIMSERQRLPTARKPRKMAKRQMWLCQAICAHVFGFWAGAEFRWREILEQLTQNRPNKRKEQLIRVMQHMESKGIMVYLGCGRYRLSRMWQDA